LLNIIAGTFSSGVVIPPSSYESIATVTVGSGGASTVTFSSIPSTYKHLQIRSISRGITTGTSGVDLYLTLNSDTTNYNGHQLYGDGTSAAASTTGAGTSNMYFGWIPRAGVTASAYGVYVTDLLDYQNTSKNKTVRSLGGWDGNGSGFVIYRSGLWQSTAAVSSIQISASVGNIDSYSQFALYGIKGV
jgi:hypothetical protein